MYWGRSPFLTGASSVGAETEATSSVTGVSLGFSNSFGFPAALDSSETEISGTLGASLVLGEGFSSGISKEIHI